MQCPYCKIDGTIETSSIQVTGDDSPDTKTQVYTVQEIACRNPACSHFGEIVATVRHLML